MKKKEQYPKQLTYHTCIGALMLLSYYCQMNGSVGLTKACELARWVFELLMLIA